MPDEPTATLWVSTHTSTCGRCRKGAFLDATHHDRIATGFDMPDPLDKPCGARFTSIGSLRIEYKEEHLRAFRPDLPYQSREGGNPPL
ncbi:hypothetical protein ACIOKD_14305 [Streptomyces sp. NPDC087844]|uniref:hypothetical protein n=1 Tax=Streptomyces sp. NPDC087844 TaxID=3365805 RepID=UPI003805823C